MIKAQADLRHMKQKYIAKKVTGAAHRSGSLIMFVTSAGVLLFASMFARGTVGVFAASCTTTSDCAQQISNLNAQNAQAQSTLSGLQAQASSYQDAINRLQAQINGYQQQINTNQQEQNDLQAQIAANQVRLADEKATLASVIKAMYVDGQPTTLEMLASSGDLSSFLDKEQYRTDVQQKIQQTLTAINATQKTLGNQEAAVAQLLQSLQAQQAQLASAQNQQTSLLSYNQSQQDSYNQQIQSNKSALSQLYAQQAAIIAASFGGGGGIHYGGTGNYPYADAVCLNSSGDCGAGSESPYNWGYPPNQPYDLAGWQYRNCTSYAFWRLAQVTGITLTAASFPSVYNHGGEIKYSPSDFRNMGYTVDSNPVGSAVLAVATNGTFGHIMYVEGVVNGQAVVSQYNAQENGLYSTATITNTSGIVFVHIR